MMPGVRPGGEVILFWQKDPKPVALGVVGWMPFDARRIQRQPNSLRLYGLFLSFLRSSEGSGVEGHRFASASYWTDGLRLLPSTSSTSMKNLAAGLLTADLNASLRWCGPPHWCTLFWEATRMQPGLNVGVDVAKDTVVVACAEQHFPVHEIRNQRTALRTWLKSLPAGSRLGLESTKTYHEVLADLAHAHGPTVFLLNPMETRH